MKDLIIILICLVLMICLFFVFLTSYSFSSHDNYNTKVILNSQFQVISIGDVVYEGSCEFDSAFISPTMDNTCYYKCIWGDSNTVYKLTLPCDVFFKDKLKEL